MSLQILNTIAYAIFALDRGYILVVPIERSGDGVVNFFCIALGVGTLECSICALFMRKDVKGFEKFNAIAINNRNDL
jgi:hypothetical protein